MVDVALNEISCDGVIATLESDPIPLLPAFESLWKLVEVEVEVCSS